MNNGLGSLSLEEDLESYKDHSLVLEQGDLATFSKISKLIWTRVWSLA
jgi:hypothetical protein